MLANKTAVACHVVDDVEVRVEGEGDETIVMVHGWPDTYRLWDAQVEFLKARYRCVRFTLPGFDATVPARPYTIDQVVAFLHRVVAYLSPGRKVVLMLHDWGCAFGYEFAMRHPELVSRIVGVDIGNPKGLQRAWTARAKFLVMAYQVWLAFAWKLGGPLGDWMTVRTARWIGRPADGRYISFRMTYPYYLSWFGGEQAYRRHMHPFRPQCPMLFLYGRRKPFMFHTQAWIDELARRKGNRVVGFDTGHWVMLQQPERFNQVVGEWLSA
jgi:pimeloyl-ACP methyl ester carboxylesterase